MVKADIAELFFINLPQVEKVWESVLKEEKVA